MLLECAVGDAFGAGYEYNDEALQKWGGDINKGYVQHGKHKGIRPGMYTDDTQMSIAITEAILSGDEWTPKNIVKHFLAAFLRDPRDGYARRFQAFLEDKENQTPEGFLANIKPESEKSVAAMRVGPLGVVCQNFTTEAKRDEDWFILVHVDIEAKANDALHALNLLNGCCVPDRIGKAMSMIRDSLAAMNATLARMPEACSPEVYYAKVRPYIFGFNGIVYEGCFDNQPQSYRGETGAQSTIVPAILRALGIKHKDSMLTKHLDDMLDYMPVPHVAHMHQPMCDIRWFCNREREDGRPELRDLYNECVNQLILFRKQHFDYAVNYIEKRVANPTGTGGTPYIKWLGQLIDETKEHLL